MQGFDSYNTGGSGPEERDTDVARVVHVLLFALRALRRRMFMALAIAVVMYTVIVIALFIIPRTYRVQSRTLTAGSSLLPALASPSRIIDIKKRSARAGVVERIKSRAALRAVVKQTDLAATWGSTRAPLGQGIDYVRTAILGPIAPEEMEDILVGMLDGKVIAYFEGETLIIDVFWHERIDARRIADAVLDLFLESRREMELAEVKETVNIIRARLDVSTKRLEETTRNYTEIVRRKAVGEVRMETKTIAVRTSANGGAESAATTQKRKELEKELRKSRGAASKAQTQADAKVQTAKRELTKLSTYLGPEHPDVKAAKRNVAKAKSSPADLREFRAKTREIQAALKKLEGDATGGASTIEYKTIQVPAARSAAGRTIDGIRINEDPDVEHANQQFLLAFRRTEALGDRLEEAETEVEVSTAAFRYRYTITVPPLPPKKPIKPKVPLMLVAGLIVSIIIGAFFAFLADLWSRRVIEPWQIETIAQVRVLGVIDAPDPRRELH